MPASHNEVSEFNSQLWFLTIAFCEQGPRGYSNGSCHTPGWRSQLFPTSQPLTYRAFGDLKRRWKLALSASTDTPQATGKSPLQLLASQSYLDAISGVSSIYSVTMPPNSSLSGQWSKSWMIFHRPQTQHLAVSVDTVDVHR